MLVSVIIPTLGQALIFKEILESLEKQTLQPDEIVIVDSSKDGAIENLCSSYIKNLPIKSYFIVLTHSHDYDFKIINEILRLKKFEFLGLIGSNTKFIRFKKTIGCTANCFFFFVFKRDLINVKNIK